MYMVLSAVCFAAAHAGVRELSPEIHPFETAFFRTILGLLLMMPWLMRNNFAAFKTQRIKLHAFRGFLNSGFLLGFFLALGLIPIAEATALNFTAPLFGTLLAIFILKEQVGWRRWAALLIGFAATLIILKPGSEVISVGAFLVLFASLAWASSMVVLKKLGKTESSITSTLYLLIFLSPISLIASLPYFIMPTGEQLLWLIEVAATSTAAQVFLADSLKNTDASLVLPFDFSRLIWAAVFGYLLFGEVADVSVWIGGAIIFVSTVYITYRETYLKRKQNT